jgi:ATP-dependent exoDNAse (exonuclease V) alpha subunit
VEIAIGMRVMVTENVETDLDITNGACGEIVGIILHENEPPIAQEAVVKLRYLQVPAYILVKLSRTKASKLTGLDDCVIPVEPSSTTYRMTMVTKGGRKGPRTVRRRQFPITAAYAFTDYRSQGQTITYVLVDIAPPPRGTLSLFNLYVALSRSSGRDTIPLLRDFDDDMFKKSHDPAS